MDNWLVAGRGPEWNGVDWWGDWSGQVGGAERNWEKQYGAAP